MAGKPTAGEFISLGIGQQGSLVERMSYGALRDYFAGQALAGIWRHPLEGYSRNIERQVEFAYTVADAMLLERMKPPHQKRNSRKWSSQ